MAGVKVDIDFATQGLINELAGLLILCELLNHPYDDNLGYDGISAAQIHKDIVARFGAKHLCREKEKLRLWPSMLYPFMHRLASREPGDIGFCIRKDDSYFLDVAKAAPTLDRQFNRAIDLLTELKSAVEEAQNKLVILSNKKEDE